MPYNNRNFNQNKGNGGLKTRYVEVTAKRISNDAQSSNPNAQPVVQQPNSSVIRITLMGIEKADAQQIISTIIPNAKFWVMSDKWHTPSITFTIPEAKFAKWVRVQVPKVLTVLESSTTAKYMKLDELEDKIMIKIHDAPSEKSMERANTSIKELEEAIYKAIQNNKWDEAMVLYKKAINLISRVYGWQLSPNNVKSIYAQAQSAGISPSDKGAATNSYWPDGTEKFWPTFVRSALTWKKWGRKVKDEPKMQYVFFSGNKVKDDAPQDKINAMGITDRSKLGVQQKDVIDFKGIKNNFKGAGYDISDTEGPDDFFDSLGLLNNLDGTLTPKAVLDKEEWEKKIAELKAQQSNVDLDKRQKLIDAGSSEERQAQVYLETLKTICQNDQWNQFNITPRNGNDPITDFLLTVNDMAKAKISKIWKNPSNVDRIAEMVTAAVAISTVGTSKIPSLGFNYSNVSTVFSSFEECKSTVLGVSDSILSALSNATSIRDDANMNEHKFKSIFNTLMERMENIYNEGYKYELNEGMIHRPSDDKIMAYLEELGVNFDGLQNNETNNLQ